LRRVVKVFDGGGACVSEGAIGAGGEEDEEKEEEEGARIERVDKLPWVLWVSHPRLYCFFDEPARARGRITTRGVGRCGETLESAHTQARRRGGGARPERVETSPK
jgi:hypothetical protein